MLKWFKIDKFTIKTGKHEQHSNTMQNVFPRTLPPCAELKRIHNVLERNALFETRQDETGFMFDC